jgi:nucleotide-binding universal stress UspA family protein
MTKQINVGLDGSASSSEAVMWAAAEASSRGARLRVISCYPIPVISPAMFELSADDAYIAVLDETHAGLRRIHAVIAESHPVLDVETLASSDPAASALIDGVSADDLVVVGTSNHHGAVGLWLGNTAHHVVRHSPCPVIVVPGPGSWGHTDRIVVGVDGSPTSRRALQWAGDEADRHGVKLLVVHAWMYPYMHSDPDSSQVRDLTRVDAACLVDREVETVRERFAAEVAGRLIECSPASALLATVRHGDLLVLGSNGHGAIHATLFGSTVSTVLDRCSVPTVVVRST